MATLPGTQAADSSAHTPQPRPAPWRAIAIGALLIPVATYYGNYAYVVVQALLWGQTALLRGAVFVLFLLALANLCFRRITHRAGLQPSEMLVIYSMIAISVCLSGFGQIQWLVNLLPAGPYYATASNHYARFLGTVPRWLTPHDPHVIADFYRGHSTVYRADVLADWAAPVAAWSLFLCLLFWVSLCLCSLVRRQWSDQERLAFPLIYLPVEIAQAGAGRSGFFKSRLMWAGFIVAFLLESVDYINFFYPTFPYIQIKPYHLEPFFAAQPWNSVGTLTIAFYPFAIGIAFLLSREVAFSCWFFYLLTKVQYIVTASMGADEGGGARGSFAAPPYIDEQGVGAFVALGLLLLWNARRPLIEAMRSLWDRGLAARIDDPVSLLPPLVAFWGGLAGVLALTTFLTIAGLPIWIALLFWTLYLLFLLVLTRILAEAGAGWAWGPEIPVHSIILQGAGSQGVEPRTLTLFGYLSWFDVEYRDSPMPHQLEAMKLGQESHTNRRQLLWALLLAALLSVLSGFWAHLHIYYEFGAASAKVRPALQGLGPNMLRQIDNWLKSPKHPDGNAFTGIAVGAVILVGLAILRRELVWWPLHPIGYALAGTLSMEYMWCPFFIAWLIKTLMIRYGGIRAYRQALPFFLGLILGDYVTPMLWGLWGTVEHTQVYMAFPH